MAILSSSGAASIGNDLQIILTTNVPVFGVAVPIVPLPIPNIMSFEWRQLTTSIGRNQIDSYPAYIELPMGYEGSIEFLRGNTLFEHALIAQDLLWNNGGNYQFSLLTCIDLNTGAGVFIFGDVAVKVIEGGNWKGDEPTRCRLQFKASRLL